MLHHVKLWQGCGAEQEPLLSKSKLSTMDCGHHVDGWLLCARHCACPDISPLSIYADCKTALVEIIIFIV